MEFFNYTSAEDFRNLDYNYYLLKVTPQMASELLRKTCGNRDTNKNNLAKIESCIEDGKYYYDVVGSGIAFDKLGRLVNGHHTLHAIQNKQKETIVTLCVGIEPSHLAYVDTGKSRSLKDSFIMSDNDDAKNLRKIAQNLCRMEDGITITNVGNMNFTHDRVITFAVAHKTELQRIMDNEKELKKRQNYWCYQHDRLEIGVTGAIMYDLIYNEGYNEDVVNEFFYGIRSSKPQMCSIIEKVRSKFFTETIKGLKTTYSFEAVDKILRETFKKYANMLSKEGREIFAIKENEISEV